MINNIKYMISHNFNPYKNLALEEYLLDTVEKDSCILYLWQNEHTIVIGKNQNAWKECLVTEFEESGGNLVRRLSGGGAVYHDHGNLNFTFLVHQDHYDVNKQLSVIIKALEYLGIHAEFTGRNDITVDGKKFSGNAFYTKGENSYHHGTLLIHVDMQSLSKYLNVSKDKLKSKGVESVKSRVVNLTEYKPDLNIEIMRDKLIQAFSEVYGVPAEEMKEHDFEQDRLNALYEKFISWDWKYGRKIEFEYRFSNRYSWGGIELNLEVNSGKINECVVYSDAMNSKLMEDIPSILLNCEYSVSKMIEAVDKLSNKYSEDSLIIEDIKNLIKEKI